MKQRCDYLKRGDLSEIAKKVGHTRNTVYKVHCGLANNAKIKALIDAVIAKRKEELDALIKESI